VDGLNLSVEAGEIFGLLGPNGRREDHNRRHPYHPVLPTSGRAFLAGVDVAAHPALAKQLSGIVSQQNTLDRQLTVWENLYFHGRLFGMGAKASRRTADELLEQFQLSRWAKASVYALSGGMAQRLMVARAIFHRPSVLFLTSPPRAWTRRAGSRCGTCSASCTARARRSCSPRTTWKKRTSSATGSRSWTRQDPGPGHAGRAQAERRRRHRGHGEDGGDTGRLAELLSQDVDGVTRTRLVGGPGGEGTVELHMQGSERLVPRIVLAAERGGFDLVDLSISEPSWRPCSST